MYSNEPKINQHSLWTGIGQHLRTLLIHLACKTYIMAMYAKNTPQGLKMTMASTSAAQILFKWQGDILWLLEYTLNIVKKEFRFLIFCIFHRPYRRIWNLQTPCTGGGGVTIDQFQLFCLLWHGLDLLHILRSSKKKGENFQFITLPYRYFKV